MNHTFLNFNSVLLTEKKEGEDKTLSFIFTPFRSEGLNTLAFYTQ